MAKNKWLWVGCGGCLGVVVLLLIVVVGFGLMVRGYFGSIKSDMDTMKVELKQLQQDFPFTPPTDQKVEGNRYDQFLSVREKVTTTAESELDWLIQLVKSSDKKKDFNFWGFLKNILSLPRRIAQIGKTQVTALRDVKMSPNEYAFLTRMTAAEIYSWSQLEATDPKVELQKKYLKPLRDIHDGIKEARKRNPGSNIQTGPINYEDFISAIEENKDPNHTNRELITAKMDRILASSAAVFVDAITVSNLLNGG